MNAVIIKDNVVTPIETSYDILEKVIAMGDISKLSSKERIEYYSNICKSVGLNPLTRPFEFIKFDGKMTLYARKDCSEQLRFIHHISIYKVEKETINDVFVYTCYGRTPAGKEDVGTGAVYIKGLVGKALANAYKIAETQSKRRMTLSICGLAWTDESEVPDVPNAQIVKVNHETGEIEEPNIEKEIGWTKEDRQKMLDGVKNAKNLTELKTAYSIAYTSHQGRLEIMEDITAAKDNLKEIFDKQWIEDFKSEPEELNPYADDNQ